MMRSAWGHLLQAHTLLPSVPGTAALYEIIHTPAAIRRRFVCIGKRQLVNGAALSWDERRLLANNTSSAPFASSLYMHVNIRQESSIAAQLIAPDYVGTGGLKVQVTPVNHASGSEREGKQYADARSRNTKKSGSSRLSSHCWAQLDVES